MMNLNCQMVLILLKYSKNNNRLVFKIKNGYKIELKTPEPIKLFGRTEILIGKTKNGENMPSLEVVK